MASVPLLMAPITTVETDADPYNLSERFGAAFELGVKDTFVSRFMQSNMINDELEMKDPIGKLQPEELNQRFKDVEIPFDKPTSFLMANEINEEAKEKKRLLSVITNNGKDGGTAISLASGLLAHALDPVEAGADILLGLGTAGVGNLLTGAAKVGKFGKKSAAILSATERARSMGTLTKNMIEGVAANAALEPYFLDTSKTMQEKYDLSDSAISIIGGGIVFPAAAHGLGRGFRGIANNAKWMGEASKSVISQLASGKRPDLSVIGKIRQNHFTAKTMALPDTLRGSYKYMEMSPDELTTRKFYMIQDTQGVLDYSEHRVPYSSNYFGEDGVHITDSPIEAERGALDPMGDVGEVRQISLKTQNLLDIDQPVTEFGYVRDAIDDPILKEAFDDAESLNAAFKDITDLAELNGHDVRSVTHAMHNAIKSQGFDGVNYREEGTANGAFIYAPENIKDEAILRPDPKEAPVVNTQDIMKAKEDMLNNPKRDIFFNENIQKEIDEFKGIDEFNLRKNEEYLNKHKTDLQQLRENGLATKEDEATLKMLELEEKLDLADDVTFKKIVNCLLRFGK